MYQGYFGLSEAPFSIAPSPRYLFMSQRHQEALAHLLYGVNGDGGFVLLTGEVGTGKTTVCRGLLEQVPDTCDVAYIFNPKLTVEELLSTICAEFGIACPAGNTSIKVFVDCINAHLLDAHARGRHAVLIIDEAQNLSPEVLEQMRLLTNLETNERKLLQIILIGQPELTTLLERPELRQLAQRIVARYHLAPLSKQEVAAYVRHRLDVAGCQRPLFPAALMARLHRLSGGVPRLINVLCDRALLGASVQGKERVDRKTLEQAAREVLHKRPLGHSWLWRATAASLVALAGVAVAAAVWRQDAPPKTEAVSSKAVAKATVDPAPAPPPAVALDWPAEAPIANSAPQAYAALFQAWGASYQDGDPCRQAEAQGLRCLAARGGLDELRALNRPAVLQLSDNQGQAFQATLLDLAPDRATFAVAGTTRTVALAALATQWSGHYSLLWRVPPFVGEMLRPGDAGPGVAWLLEQLARTRGEVPPAGRKPAYDATVMREVKQFQLGRGLVPDGSAGPQTLIRLAAETDPAAPSLVQSQSDAHAGS